MSNIFLISDTHWGHQGSVVFTNYDGSKMRPWDNVEDMDQAMVDNWNRVVGPKDKVYHLGDVVINRRALPINARLNGDKVLIKGNHDLFRLEEYIPYFRDIRGSHKLDNFILTHIPLHPASLVRWTSGNIHGHTHGEQVRKEDGAIDLRYMCVSVEQINFTPISFEDAKKKFLERIQLCTP